MWSFDKRSVFSGLLLLLFAVSLCVVFQQVSYSPSQHTPLDPQLVSKPSLLHDDISEVCANVSNDAVKLQSDNATPLHEDYIIPPIIHQSWKDENVPELTSSDQLQYPYKKWIQSWTQFNPTWTYMFWTDDDNMKLFETRDELEPYRETYRRLGGVARADLARYAYMYLYGGVYADLDFECLRSFDSLAKSLGAFVSTEPLDQTMSLYNTPQFTCNAIMGSKPGHFFWVKAMDKVKDNVMSNHCGDAVGCTGPAMLQGVYESFMRENWGEPLSMLPSQYFYPELAEWNLDNMRNRCANLEREGKYTCKGLNTDKNAWKQWHSFAVHHWACQWCRSHSTTNSINIASVVPANQLTRPSL